MMGSCTIGPLLSSALFLASCSEQAQTSATNDVRSARSRSSSTPLDTDQVGDYILSAFEDSRGHLWFGTNGQGAARWDGETLRYYSIAEGLIDDVVTSIAEDRAGHLWFGTQVGASRYDGETFTGFGPAEGLPGAGCKLLVDRTGGLWAGTSAGVFRYTSGRFTAFALPVPDIDAPSYKIVPGKVWALFEDSKGRIWFGRDGYGACVLDGASFKHYTQRDGLCSNNVASIVEDAQGDLWFGSITSDHPRYIEEGGVSRFDGRSFIRFPDERGLIANDIYKLGTDRSGNVWIGAVRVGVYRYDGRSFALFDKIDRPDLTGSFSIQAFVQDRHGTRWFGFSGGLFRFDGTMFRHVTKGGPWQSP